MENNVILSFVVPVYNAENYLPRCIESIISQSVDLNFEAIFINDGSNDNSLDILLSYQAKDSRIIIINQSNSGVSKARNAGIENARGRYVAFVDADDWVEPSYIQRLYEACDTKKSCLVIEGCIEESEVGNTIRKYEKGEYESDRFENLFSERRLNVMGVPWGKLYDLDLIRNHNIRFEPELMFCEDFLFMLSYLCFVEKVIFIDKTDYHYIRKKSGSLITKYYSFEKEFLGFEVEKATFDVLINKYPQLSKYKFWSGFLALRSIKTMYKFGSSRLSRDKRINNLKKFSKSDTDLIRQYGIQRNNKLALFFANQIIVGHFAFFDVVVSFLFKIKKCIKNR